MSYLMELVEFYFADLQPCLLELFKAHNPLFSLSLPHGALRLEKSRVITSNLSHAQRTLDLQELTVLM